MLIFSKKEPINKKKTTYVVFFVKTLVPQFLRDK